MKALVTVLSLFFFSSAFASILPPNNLHLQQNLIGGGISKAQFDKVIDEVEEVYAPIVASHGAKLKISRLWNDPTVNASADQSGRNWLVKMYGGLARRPEVTEDAFMLVLCHEMGHHLGGFAFYEGDDWASNEGQSDYFATQSCAKEMWSGSNVRVPFVEAIPKARCDAAYQQDNERNLCYRTAMAGKALATLLGALNMNALPSFTTPDKAVVRATFDGHPAAQCRLDTYLAAAACTKSFDPQFIPGKELSNNRSAQAELEAYEYSCSEYGGYSIGSRPKCWFKPKVGNFEGLAYFGSP